MDSRYLIKDLEAAAVDTTRADGRTLRTLSLPAAHGLAARWEIPLRHVEITALENGIVPQRYVRNFDAYDVEEQLRLLNGSVFLVGLGGLGGTVLELLARAGVGNIIAADGDVFEESNCNRQLLCTVETLNTPKSLAARERVSKVNPAVSCLCLQEQLQRERMLELLRQAGEQAVVVDALGGLESRPALWSVAQEAGRPMVTAAVAGTSGCVGSFFPGDPGPELLFGAGAPVSGETPSLAAEETLGTQGPGVHLAASLQAQETLRLLTAPHLQKGRTLLFDLSDFTFEAVRL